MTDFLPRLDRALAARGMSDNAAGKAIGKPWRIPNWRGGQDPGVANLGELCAGINVDPAWVAYGKEPVPVAPPNGFHAHSEPLDQPDTLLGVAYSAWKADDGRLEARFFDALEMLGLLDALYLIRMQDGELIYDHIGALYRKTLGWCWWAGAHGKPVSDDPDQAFCHWSLGRWQMAMQRGEPFRDRCLVASRYTGITKGWGYDTLVLPVDGGLVVICEVSK